MPHAPGNAIIVRRNGFHNGNPLQLTGIASPRSCSSVSSLSPSSIQEAHVDFVGPQL